MHQVFTEHSVREGIHSSKHRAVHSWNHATMGRITPNHWDDTLSASGYKADRSADVREVLSWHNTLSLFRTPPLQALHPLALRLSLQWSALVHQVRLKQRRKISHTRRSRHTGTTKQPGNRCFSRSIHTTCPNEEQVPMFKLRRIRGS